ncbi:conserved hypothetical protein [Ricinus communis]|uniref:F-box protein At3g26010-like beta-propeller domain-containing protein n=1 Tax=Ricinus communis TaxID=3988 RepID=B9S6G1_RICCO|nr:conserved hypothetical protein [Ricinus communis]
MANLKCDKLEEMVNDLMIDDVEEDPFSQGIQQWMNMDPLKSDAMTGYDMYPSYWYNSIPPRVVDPSPEDIAKSADNIKMQRGVGIGDIVKEHALPFLSAKSLCKFRTVSKQWDQWIISPFFAHKQTVHYKNVSGLFRQLPGRCPSFISFDQAAFGIPSNSLSFLPEPVDIRSSCNGLVCCQGCDEDQAYYICNPATKDWRKLPSPKLYHGPGTAIVLAFEPSLFNFSANYELICAVNWSDLPALHFEIYSSRTGSWKISETVCCEVDALALNGDGFYMRGIAYWETQSGSVLAFNINYEYFGIFSLPPRSGPTGALTEMHGGLCYLLPQEESKLKCMGT